MKKIDVVMLMPDDVVVQAIHEMGISSRSVFHEKRQCPFIQVAGRAHKSQASTVPNLTPSPYSSFFSIFPACRLEVGDL